METKMDVLVVGPTGGGGELLEAIRVLAMPHAESPYGLVTVSISVASWPTDMALDAAALIE